jgi:hypothetical protein
MVSVEVHRVYVDDGGRASGIGGGMGGAGSRRAEPRRSYEECIVRVLSPPPPPSSSPRSGAAAAEDGADGGGEDDDDDSSTLAVGSAAPELLSQGRYAPADYRGWRPKWKLPVGAVTVKGWHRSKVIVQIRLGGGSARKVQLRELIFASPSDSERFRRELGAQHEKEDARRDARLRAQLGERGLLHLADQNEQLAFLVEVVSGWSLPVGDVTTSDPFVKVSFNGAPVHETKHIPKTCVVFLV